jgi:hypothetical protein
MKQDTYESPTITELGSVEDFTRQWDGGRWDRNRRHGGGGWKPGGGGNGFS